MVFNKHKKSPACLAGDFFIDGCCFLQTVYPSDDFLNGFRGECFLDLRIFKHSSCIAMLEEVVQPPPKVTPPQATFAPQGFCRRFSHLLRSCPSGNVCTPKCRRRTPIDPLWQRNRTKTLPDSTPPITNITPHRQVQRSVRLNRLFFKDIEKAAGHYGREAFTNIFINNWLHNTPQSVAGGRHYDETSILNIQ